jgi:hypothetical protein
MRDLIDIMPPALHRPCCPDERILPAFAHHLKTHDEVLHRSGSRMSSSSTRALSDEVMWAELLSSLTALTMLDLGGCTQVTDVGLQHLRPSAIKLLYVDYCFTTKGGWGALKAALPALSIWIGVW